MVKRADLILIGEVKDTLPSQWMGSGDLQNASPEEITRAQGLFTDSLISINQNLKGNIEDPIVRVRVFTGETAGVRWIGESEPSYVVGRTYLLFLKKDTGPTEKVNPGDYIAVGAFQGVYEIMDGKAISKTDEWNLDELIAYIQNKLSEADATVAPTDTPSAPTGPSTTEWVSKAMTVNELMAESDLVVRARVSEAPVTRILRHELPEMDKNGKPSGVFWTLETPFSDTVFEIIKTYRGTPHSSITVMQTGGFGQKEPTPNFEFADDPLYKIGEEYILFLVDITGDDKNAPDRELYRTVNPFGRYRINGESVFSYGQNLLRTVQLPSSVKELEAQILIIPGDLALDLALMYSKDEGLDGWQTPPEKNYGQVMKYSEAVQFVFDKSIDPSTEEYKRRDKIVWLVAFEGEFVEHVPASAGGDIPAEEVMHSQMVVILDGNTGEVMRQVLLSPQIKLPFADLPILQKTGQALPLLPTRGPILTEAPYPTLPPGPVDAFATAAMPPEETSTATPMP